MKWKMCLFRSDLEALANDFDDWLVAAETDGRLTELRHAHGLPERPTATPSSALLASLDERLSLMPAVGRAKRALGRPIEDREREERVVAAALRGVERAAAELGRSSPPEEAIERLFHAQIETAKWIQEQIPVDASPTPDPDIARQQLEQALRPSLIRLGDRIARLVVRLPDQAGEPIGLAETTDALSRHGLPEERLRALAEALHAVSSSQEEAGERTGTDG